MLKILRKLLPSWSRSEEPKATGQDGSESIPASDPLDPIARIGKLQGWNVKDDDKDYFPVKVEDFPVHRARQFAQDGALLAESAMDDGSGSGTLKNINGGFPGTYNGVPPALMDWYGSQGFIGYQACAIIAQHWLVDKACSMSGEDAIRNGWELKTEGDEMNDTQLNDIREMDVKFKLKDNLSEFNRFKNIFGIRVAIFEVESDDPNYYEKPFNIDGVAKDSYRGISQVDPYWMTPVMTSASTSNPAAINFYEPEFWVISGKKYHRSHLVIARGPAPADILKPTYIFGGIPLTQRIYERVYAAERTANEAPLLALSKRTTALHVDVEKAMANEQSFTEKLMFWVKYRDNHAVKVLGKQESMEQFDTNLSDFDSLIMNQYQLVAAIAKTPSTKLLGTSPKGFNATGEFETDSYHEELESIEEHTMDPMLDRHYLILAKSLGLNIRIKVVWNSVDSIGTQKRAELNSKKAEAHDKYVNMGAISPDEVRQSLRDDQHSGYNRLTEDVANQEPGMSPENIADFEKAGADKGKAEAEQLAAAANGTPPGDLTGQKPDDVLAKGSIGPGSVPEASKVPANQETEVKDAPEKQSNVIANLIAELNKQLGMIDDHLLKEGEDIAFDHTPGLDRSVKPSTEGAIPTTTGAGAVVSEREQHELQRIKMNGLITCIENPRGSIRVSKNGDWKVKMPHHYGFLKGTKGADGDELDCFVGNNLKSKRVFVINQVNKEGVFDEHKCMLGFDSAAAATKGYNDSFSPGWDGLGSMVEMDMKSFRRWMNSGDLTKELTGKDI